MGSHCPGSWPPAAANNHHTHTVPSSHQPGKFTTQTLYRPPVSPESSPHKHCTVLPSARKVHHTNIVPSSCQPGKFTTQTLYHPPISKESLPHKHCTVLLSARNGVHHKHCTVLLSARNGVHHKHCTVPSARKVFTTALSLFTGQ